MHGDFLYLGHQRVSLLVQVLLTEAKNEVANEEAFHKVVDDHERLSVRDPEGRVVGVDENIVAGDEEHEDVEGTLPVGVLFYHQDVEEVGVLSVLVAVVVLLEIHLIDLNQLVVHYLLQCLFLFVAHIRLENLLVHRSLRQLVVVSLERLLEPEHLVGEQISAEEEGADHVNLFVFLFHLLEGLVVGGY